MNKITWTLQEVDKDKIKANAMNPKIRNADGFNRLKKSLDKFGNVYDGILNADYSLIDGHSRLEATDKKSGMYFMPSRKLTDKEYIEMNGMFDHAKAGELDFDIIAEIFDEDMLNDWSIDNISNVDVDAFFENNGTTDGTKETKLCPHCGKEI